MKKTKISSKNKEKNFSQKSYEVVFSQGYLQYKIGDSLYKITPENIKNNLVLDKGFVKYGEDKKFLSALNFIDGVSCNTCYNQEEIIYYRNGNFNISLLNKNFKKLKENQENLTIQITKDIQKFQGILQMDVGTLQTGVTGLQTDVGTLQTDATALKTDVTELQTDVGTLETNITELQTDVGKLETDVGTLQTDVTGLQTNFQALEETVKNGRIFSPTSTISLTNQNTNNNTGDLIYRFDPVYTINKNSTTIMWGSLSFENGNVAFNPLSASSSVDSAGDFLNGITGCFAYAAITNPGYGVINIKKNLLGGYPNSDTQKMQNNFNITTSSSFFNSSIPVWYYADPNDKRKMTFGFYNPVTRAILLKREYLIDGTSYFYSTKNQWIIKKDDATYINPKNTTYPSQTLTSNITCFYYNSLDMSGQKMIFGTYDISSKTFSPRTGGMYGTTGEITVNGRDFLYTSLHSNGGFGGIKLEFQDGIINLNNGNVEFVAPITNAGSPSQINTSISDHQFPTHFFAFAVTNSPYIQIAP